MNKIDLLSSSSMSTPKFGIRLEKHSPNTLPIIKERPPKPRNPTATKAAAEEAKRIIAENRTQR